MQREQKVERGFSGTESRGAGKNRSHQYQRNDGASFLSLGVQEMGGFACPALQLSGQQPAEGCPGETGHPAGHHVGRIMNAQANPANPDQNGKKQCHG